jgi:hypothetical protein
VSLERAQQIARTVLYEGYMLYPYRPSSTKNRQRWNFGTLYPEQHLEVERGLEKCSLQAQCLLTAGEDARVTVRVLFLQLQDCVPAEAAAGSDGSLADQPWQEAVERTVDLEINPRQAVRERLQSNFEFAASSTTERASSDGEVRDARRRIQRPLEGRVHMSAEGLNSDLLRLTVRVTNDSPLSAADRADRVAALPSALVSAHVILHIRGGEFISLLEPPEHLRQDAQQCRNMGVYPVLVGEAGQRDLLLASPIILYDYPQIAPESAGDFFDATEMDEMLSLRVLTLTDHEKDEMRAADRHARGILERTEAAAREQLMRTHGTIRSFEHVKDGK